MDETGEHFIRVHQCWIVIWFYRAGSNSESFQSAWVQLVDQFVPLFILAIEGEFGELPQKGQMLGKFQIIEAKQVQSLE